MKLSMIAYTAVFIASSHVTQVLHAADMGSIKEEARAKIYELTGKDSTTVTFGDGSSSISASDKDTLKAMVTASKTNAMIKETLVLAYADVGYPRNQKADLPKKDQNLAEARAAAVKDQLQSFGAKDISVHNMAKKSNWFERTFETKDAQLKAEAMDKKPSDSMESAFYQALGEHLKTSGGPGKVVVVLRHDATPLTN